MNNENIFFSTVIPCYNRAGYINRVIDSILSQTFQWVEIIVVDDGSKDNTAELLRQYKERIKYIRTPNRERGAARNEGRKLAVGSYINYFDSDDEMNPCLDAVHDFIVKNDYPPVVFGAIEYISNEGQPVKNNAKVYSDFKKDIIDNNFLACGSVFLRYDVASAFSFSEDRRLSGTEDWELWLRVYAHYSFVDSGLTIFRQRQHPGRSLYRADVETVRQRELVFVECIEHSKEMLLKQFTPTALDLLLADRYTLIALAEGVGGNKKAMLITLLKATRKSWRVMGRKRFWATLRKLVP